MMSKQQLIEILTVPGCTSKRPMRDLVDSLLQENEISNVEVRQIGVATDTMAVREKFPGSPTIRVNGIDVDPEGDKQSNYGMG